MPNMHRRKADIVMTLAKEMLLPVVIKFVSVLLGLIFGPKISKEEQDGLFKRDK